ncbi:MAG: phage holin family protein [Acidobacteriota bacterium]|nr:phage holin family protein [Acidobacteriota bacterium]
MAVQNGGRTVPEVLQDIVGNIQEIIRSEFQLAKAEVKQEVAKAKSPLLMSVMGGALGLYALGFLLLTGMLAMATVMAMWMAALIIGAVLAVASVALLSAGSARLKHVHAVPERTIESIKENVQWTKDQSR